MQLLHVISRFLVWKKCRFPSSDSITFLKETYCLKMAITVIIANWSSRAGTARDRIKKNKKIVQWRNNDNGDRIHAISTQRTKIPPQKNTHCDDNIIELIMRNARYKRAFRGKILTTHIQRSAKSCNIQLSLYSKSLQMFPR